jgi:hypothetical protein
MRKDFRNVQFMVKCFDTYSRWRELSIFSSNTKDPLQEPFFKEKFVLATQTTIKGVQSITSDVDGHSTKSTTSKKQYKAKMSTHHERKVSFLFNPGWKPMYMRGNLPK